MKILIIAGFLGAGKTTFIQRLSQKIQKEFVIMENEYGQAGIDGSVLEQDRLKVWELTEGCICCSLKSDFAASILTIANTLAPEYLIVEPTGIGLLSAVRSNIAKIIYERICLLPPLTVADVYCVDSYIKEFGEVYKDQIRNAPCIVLSKTEHAAPTVIERSVQLLSSINSKACIIRTPYEQQSDVWWQSLLKMPLADEGMPDAGNGYAEGFVERVDDAVYPPPNLETVALTGVQVESTQYLMEVLVAIMRGYFGRVCRVKGFVPVNGRWVKFDIADKRYTITACEAVSAAKTVIIGTYLNCVKLQEAFGGIFV